jgi:hypothetical protein
LPVRPTLQPVAIFAGYTIFKVGHTSVTHSSYSGSQRYTEQDRGVTRREELAPRSHAGEDAPRCSNPQ